MAADLAASLGDDLAKNLLERGVGLTFRALAGTFAARRSKDKGESGGPDAERRLAYDEFRRAIVEFRTDFGVLASGPPSLVGAAWTYPIHMRLLHRSSSKAADVLNAFLAVELVGREEATAAAENVILRLGEAIDAYGARDGQKRSQRSAVDLSLLDEALAELVVVARRDLGYDKPRA